MAQTAQVNIAVNGDFELVPSVGDHIVLFGSVESIEDKLNRLYTFYKSVWVQSGLNAYQVIDCRFNNQIVALKKGMQPIQFSVNDLPIVDSAMAVEVKLDTTAPKIAPKKAAIASPKIAPKTTPKTAVKAPSKTAVKQASKKGPKSLAKTSSKTNNKSKAKSLIKVKPSAKALMPQKKASTTNN